MVYNWGQKLKMGYNYYQSGFKQVLKWIIIGVTLIEIYFTPVFKKVTVMVVLLEPGVKQDDNRCESHIHF